MIKPKFNEDQSVWEIDVPEDNSCLFWAVPLAYLIPVKDNDYIFKKRFKKLLGKGSSEQLELVKNWLRTTYNPFNEATNHNDILTKSVREQFRHRTINHMKNPKNRCRFQDHVPINNDGLDAHLNKMKHPSTWCGELEIRAISELLDCRIQVISGGQEHSYGDGTLIQLFHVGALANNPEANHYHFGLKKNLGDRYQNTSDEPPHKKARYDAEANRAVAQKEPEQQSKQTDTDKESLKPLVTHINVSLVSGSANELHAQSIKVIGTQITYKGQQDTYTAYFGEVERYGIDFKKDVIGLRPFLEGKNQILHLSFTGKDTLLGYITIGILFKRIKEKINHKAKNTEVEQQLDNYTKGNSLRVASLDWLLQKDEVLNDFDKTGENNLLVVTCTAHPSQHLAEEKLRKLFDILKRRSAKKAIFITIKDREQNGISSFIRNFSKKKLGERYIEKAGDEIKFSHLTDESEYKVLKKEVLFQGQHMYLSRLMEVNDPDDLSDKELDKLDKILDVVALLELITNNSISIGSAPPSWHDQDTFLDEETYVPRIFSRKISYANKALTKNAGDLFVVSDIEEEDFKKLTPIKEPIQLFDPRNLNIDPHKRYILLNSRTRNFHDQEEAFNKLCCILQEHHKDKVIHWIKKEKEELVWQRTWSQSHTYVYGADTSEKSSVRPAPSETTQAPGKIVVVIDEPGMGKSTTLTHVSEQVRKADKWVIRINLKDYQETIEKQLVQDDQSLLALLEAIDTQGLKATLARRLLTYRLQQQDKIVLLLDGFDEISINCQDKVLHILQFLKNEHKAEKVWITARLHTKSKLEDALSVFSYRFQPFNTEDQQRFLNRFWTKRLTGEGQRVEGAVHNYCLAYYAGELINKFSTPKSTSLKTKTLGEVIGIPLLTRMLAEIFFNDLKVFYDHNKGKNKTEFALESDSKLRTLNILELYEGFIKAKYKIYLKEKIIIEAKIDPGTKQLLIDGYAKKHRYLAFGILFSEQLESFSGIIKDKFSNNELAAIGMIKDFKSHAPHFIHPTFAEYFVADLLYMRLSKGNHNPTMYATVKRFLQENLFEARNDMIRLFLDYKLARGLSMHMAVLHGEEKESDALLQKDTASVRQVDLLGRIPLHLAVAYGYKTIIEKLMNQKGNICATDALGEYTLGYAVLSGDDEVFRLILRKGRFLGNQTEASIKILLATIKLVVQRWEKGMLELLLSYAYVNRNQVAVMLAANNYGAFQTAVKRSDYEGSKMVDFLLSKASVEQQQGMITANNYGAFQEAIKMGSSSMVDFLWSKASAEQQQVMLTSVDYTVAFQQAIQRGDSSMVDSLLSKASGEQQQGMLSANNYGAFQEAVQRVNYFMVESLWKKASGEQQQFMFTSVDYIVAFQQAVQRSDSIMVDSLWKKASGEQQQVMFTSIDYIVAFQQAVQRGDSRMVDSLCSKSSGEQQKGMLSANNYGTFQEAVQRGDSRMVESLLSKASREQQQAMFTSVDYIVAFQQAVKRVDSSMVERLLSKANDEQQQAMFTSVDYICAFQTAVQKGDSWMVNSLWSKASGEQQQVMLSSNNYVAFQQAVQRSDFNMVDCLWKKVSREQQQVMITSLDYIAAFKTAIKMGVLWMVDNLWKKSTGEQQQEMFTSLDYIDAFQTAIKRGDSWMVNSLWSKASGEQQQGMLSANNYGAFQQAVQRCDFNIVDSLWKKAIGEQQQAMFTSVDYIGAFQQAVKRGSSSMVDFLWSKASGEQQQVMFTSVDYIGAFQTAVKRDNYKSSKMIDFLWSKASGEQQKAMFTSVDYIGALQEAVKKGSSSIVDYLWSKASGEQQQQMWTSVDYIGALQEAIQKGDSRMVNSLWSKASGEQQQQMWTSVDYIGAFQSAVQSDDSRMVDSLWSKASDQQQKAMFTSVDYIDAFQTAVKRSDYKVNVMVDSLWSKASGEQQQGMLTVNNYSTFKVAVQRCSSSMVDFLWSKASGEQQQVMLTSVDYIGAFQEAVQNGDSWMVDSLWSKASDEQQKAMFTSVNYKGAFQQALKYGNSWMVDSLWSKASDEQQKAMFTSVDYIGEFQLAIQSGNSRMVDTLWSKTSSEQQKAMFTNVDYISVFQSAIQSGNSSMVDSLLSKISSEQQKAMFTSVDYISVFQSAIQSGDSRMGDFLCREGSKEQQ